MVRQRRRLRAVANERMRRERKKCSECSASVSGGIGSRPPERRNTCGGARSRLVSRKRNKMRVGAGVPPRGSPDASEDDPVARLPRPEGAASGDARGIYRTTCVQPDQRPARPEVRICHDARGFLKSRRENKMRSFGGAERAGVRSRGGVAHERDALPSRLTHLRTRAKSGSGESDEPALAVSKCLDGGIVPSEKSFCFARFTLKQPPLYTSTGRLKPNETSSSCVQYCVLPRALDVRGETLSPRTESRVFPCSPLIDILAFFLRPARFPRLEKNKSFFATRIYVVRVTRTPAR